MILDLTAKLQAKHAEAIAESEKWRQQLQLVAAQVEQWDAIRQACEELLVEDAPTPALNESPAD